MKRLLVAVSLGLSLALAGCGGGGHKLTPAPISAPHNQGGVHGLNFAWGESPPAHQLQCQEGWHAEWNWDDDSGWSESCVPN